MNYDFVTFTLGCRMMGIVWCIGYPMVATFGYFIKDWNEQYLACSICMLVSTIPSCFIIESPRFYAIKKDVTNMKLSLQKLAKLNEIELCVHGIEIADLEDKRQQNILQQLKEFIQYPTLIIETLIQMGVWFFVALAYYGFNFGWARIAPNVYLGYIMAGCSEVATTVLHATFVHFTGRRRSLIVLISSSIITFLISIIDVEIGKNWRVESVSSLAGVMFISAAFAGIYLYTIELAPTSHRGMVFAMASGSARIGSFLGPFIVNNLYSITHKAVPMCALSILAVGCIGGVICLVETADKEIPAIPAHAKDRRKYYKLAF